jgi:hypothetical protein
MAIVKYCKYIFKCCINVKDKFFTRFDDITKIREDKINIILN